MQVYNHYKILSENKLGQAIIFAAKAYINKDDIKNIYIGEIVHLNSGAIAVLAYIKEKNKNVLKPILNSSLLKIQTNNFEYKALLKHLKELEPFMRVSR